MYILYLVNRRENWLRRMNLLKSHSQYHIVSVVQLIFIRMVRSLPHLKRPFLRFATRSWGLNSTSTSFSSHLYSGLSLLRDSFFQTFSRQLDEVFDVTTESWQWWSENWSENKSSRGVQRACWAGKNLVI